VFDSPAAVPITMPSTSPIAHPVRQWSVADVATGHGTDANPDGPEWCSCPCFVPNDMSISSPIPP